jgi:hypothetical protein
MRYLLNLVVAFSIVVSACTAVTNGGTATSSSAQSEITPSSSLPPTSALTPTTFSPEIPDATAYLLEALEVMEANALLAASVDWQEQRQRAQDFASNYADRPSDLHSFIQLRLYDLGDRHSYVLNPGEAETRLGDGHQNRSPDIEQREDGIGYIGMYPFSGFFGTDEYAAALHSGIALIDQAGACGWILDLRENSGGNMWPMLAGIGPLLGQSASAEHGTDPSAVGFFIDRDGGEVAWRYIDGVAYEGSESNAVVEVPYHLVDPEVPVAVLLGPQVASSGEAIAVAFQGRPNTQTFGDPTRGTPTGIEGFTLSDGAVVGLTVVRFADRTGQPYGPLGGLVPNESGGEAEATAWLLAQPQCG